MRIDDTVLYEQFEAARSRAVEITDRYHEAAANDPRRDGLWESVMRETEVARSLLEAWLHSTPGGVTNPPVRTGDRARANVG
jgi:hypothetical protein